MDESIVIRTMQYSDFDVPRTFAATRALCTFFVVLVFFGFLCPVATFVTSQRRQRNGSCSRFELYSNISLMYLERASRVLKRLRTAVSMCAFVTTSAASLILLRNDERLPDSYIEDKRELLCYQKVFRQTEQQSGSLRSSIAG